MNYADLIIIGRLTIAKSEEALEFALNNLTITGTPRFLVKGGHFILYVQETNGSTWPPEVQEILDRYTGLTEDQENATGQFWVNILIQGWIDEILELQVYALGGSNGLIGAKGVHNGTNNGADLTIPILGAQFDGASYIDTNVNVSAVDPLRKYQVDDAFFGVFMRENRTNAITSPLGADSDNASRSYIATRYRSNTNSRIHNTQINNQPLDLNTFHVMEAKPDAVRYYRNGILGGEAGAPQVLPQFNFFVGARNDNGTPENFTSGDIGLAIWGASNIVIQDELFMQIRRYLINLDVTEGSSQLVNILLARYPSLSAPQEAALSTFLTGLENDELIFDIDSIQVYQLGSPNAPFDIGITGQGKTAVQTDISFDGTGAVFNGTSSVIDTDRNFTEVLIEDELRYQKDESFVGVYIVNSTPEDGGMVYGCEDADDNRTWLNNRISFDSGITMNSQAEAVNSPTVRNNTFRVVERVNSGGVIEWENGVAVNTDNISSTDIPDESVHIGALKRDSGIERYWQGTIALFIAGRSGIDQKLLNDYVQQLIIDLP